MKKLKALALFLALAVILGAFAACAPTPEPTPDPAPEPPLTFADILNTEYNLSDTVISSMTEISEIKGYNIYTNGADQVANNEFVVFSKTDLTDPLVPKTIYKVLSMRQGKVVLTLTTDPATKTRYSFSPVTDTNGSILPLIWVEKTFEKPATEFVLAKDVTSYTLYDASGASVMSRFEKPDRIRTLNDWIIIENTIYTWDESTGALTKDREVPVNLSLFNSYRTDNYIYTSDDDNYGDGFNIIIYDYNFNVVAVWSSPDRIAPVRSEFTIVPLNNEDVLIQYKKLLHPDAEEYDLYTQSLARIDKYDLVTEIYSITDKTSKEIEFDSVILNAFSYKSTVDDDGTSEYLESFENIVFTMPIEDQQINESSAKLEINLLSNDGTIGKSLKLTEYQTDLPYMFAEGIYKIETIYGFALIDLEGNVITQITGANITDSTNDYLVTDYGIYDNNYNLVYAFGENNAEYMGILDNTIFVKQYAAADNTDDYKIISFRAGVQTDILNHNSAVAKNPIFADADFMYAISNPETNEYSYYNSEGTALLTTAVAVYDDVAADYTNNIYIVSGNSATDLETTYFIVK